MSENPRNREANIKVLRQKLGILPAAGKNTCGTYYMVRANFRLSENEAEKLIRASIGIGLSESMFIRMCLMEKLNGTIAQEESNV